MKTNSIKDKISRIKGTKMIIFMLIEYLHYDFFVNQSLNLLLND